MPFPFVLSTTSHLSFQQNFTSSTHPSLPSGATEQRNILRSALKAHKRLSSSDKPATLVEVLSALTSYLKYLGTIDLALSGESISDEDVDVALVKEVELEWRPTLSSNVIPGRDADRVRGQGLDYEFYFAHQTYAVVQNLLARQALLGLYASPVPSAEQRTLFIQSATRYLRTACAIHAFLLHRANSSDGPPELPPAAVDISIPIQSALQRLAQAEFNLLNAFKDDPYPAIIVQARNELDREWMIKAPEIQKTRAQVLTRLCVGAAEHAAGASATLKAEGKRVSKDLVEYVDDLRRTARARACRFQAIDAADTRYETGKGIAWIYAALSELGMEINTKDGNSKQSTLSKFKIALQERKEEKRLTKGSARWGSDGGKAEEVRILEYLERKMTKSNDTLHFQKVPEWKTLLATLPSGMNMPLGNETWKAPTLSENELVQMRAPPEHDAITQDSSGDEDQNEKRDAKGPAGAFPGTQGEYNDSYY
ncbi:hypothetical protein H2198_002152 [Neophaeococcomyces mojaviensis]|uniref:Uncharacterized protein n=1 Tax=Neophaeococcomyces mojaviensis TaxID=3383035 RepID=A0ACC3AFN5_9EURO|nr:hypothetical protein H2198_002152 [Knufia sp. JES_112]